MNIYNKEQNDDSVDNLLIIVGQKPEKNGTTHSKNYRHHYQGKYHAKDTTESKKLI